MAHAGVLHQTCAPIRNAELRTVRARDLAVRGMGWSNSRQSARTFARVTLGACDVLRGAGGTRACCRTWRARPSARLIGWNN